MAMLKFYCGITGDDVNLLKADTPESIKKVAALASTVFIPTIIWVIIGYLMVSVVLKGNILAAIITSFVMGMLIFLIEKNIIMAHTSRAIKTFRIALGIVISLLGAVCLDEVIFKPDIDQQLSEMNRISIAANLARVDNSYRDVLSTKQMDVNKKYAVWQQALINATKEADGSGGSGRKGVDAITIIKLNAADICKGDYEKTKLEFEALNTKLDLEKIAVQTSVQNSFQDAALLNRIKALFRLVFSNWAMGIIYLLVTALLFFMEFLVVFLKNAWPQTNYERKLELIEEIGRKRMDKVRQNDISHFEAGKVYPSYKNAKEELAKSGNISIFN